MLMDCERNGPSAMLLKFLGLGLLQSQMDLYMGLDHLNICWDVGAWIFTASTVNDISKFIVNKP